MTGFQTIILFKHHILKRHIPEHPRSVSSPCSDGLLELRRRDPPKSEGGMMRLETLIEQNKSQFELSERILLLKLDKQFSIEQFEATDLSQRYPPPS